MDRPHLFSPLNIREITFRNRIGVSPMCMYSSDDGVANRWHHVHLGSRAVGGAALVFTEATAITAQGRISPQDLGIWKDEHVPALAETVRYITDNGAVAGMQLAHAGRKASTARPWDGGKPVGPEKDGWTPIVAPSPLPFMEGYQTPAALDEAGIRAVVEAFGSAAKRALTAGFGVVEIHSAHGYLLHEFLSPISNQRTDRYGGSLENRTRIVREVVESVRRVWPERLPLFLRISSTDWVPEGGPVPRSLGGGGWTPDDSVELARMVKPLGVDVIDCSSGGTLPRTDIPLGPGYQVPFAERIRREAGVATAAVGLITDPSQADQVIRNGQADFVVLARQLLRDPYWPLHAAQALGQKVEWPVQYRRAAP